ncbi:MAG: hypothetical protein WCA16_04565 [Candidatus Sulfotelmatobacter sp.]
MPYARKARDRHDLPTAVTFFLAGLGIGSLLAILLASRGDDMEASSSLTHQERFATRAEAEVL